MIRQFRREEAGKKKRLTDAEEPPTGSEETEPLADTYSEDIDPAEFFDPEEFGIRRGSKPHEP